VSPPAGCKADELTGPRSQDVRGLAAEYNTALVWPITSVEVPQMQ
jgi:hypothetical protein